MKKNDFIRSFSVYEYWLRTVKDPFIDLLIYAGDSTTPNVNYYVLINSRIFNSIQAHLNTSFQMRQTIFSDHKIKNDHTNFFGLFLYDNKKDTVSLWGTKEFQDGEYTSEQMVNNITSFLAINGIQKNNQLPIGSGNVSLKKTYCDCGAQKLGYQDEESHAHARWCSVNSKTHR